MDQSVYQSGSTLKGSVYFDINKEVSASSLVAILEGKEETRVEYDEGAGEDRKERTAFATRPIVSLPIPLRADFIQNGKIQPGKYQAPFEISLPSGLPASFQAGHVADACASIKYEIRAQLKGSGWISDYKARQVVNLIGAPLPAQHNPYNGAPDEKHVKFCCCFNKGYILFAARVDDTSLDKGESVRVLLSCKNRTSVKQLSVSAQLDERLEWSAENKFERRHRTLATVDFSNSIGLQETMSLNQPSTQQDLEDVRRDLEQGAHVGTIIMPTDANDTFVGKLISCRHILRIVIKTPWCIDNPTVEIPIQAGPAPLEGRPASTSSSPTIPEGYTNVSETVHVSSDTAMLGGAAVTGAPQGDDVDVWIPPAAEASKVPSIERLLKELDNSVVDFDLVRQRTTDSEWKSVFEGMTPAHYGKIVKQVDLDFDQPKVAEEMARVMGDKFTCAHVIAAVRGATEWNRSTIVEKTLQFCVDLKQNKDNILQELSQWEKTVTERAFENALKA